MKVHNTLWAPSDALKLGASNVPVERRCDVVKEEVSPYRRFDSHHKGTRGLGTFHLYT